MPVIRTRQLQDAAGSGGAARYLDAWVVYDSLLRERQTHALSPASGNLIVTDTRYDNRRLAVDVSLPQAVSGTAGSGLLPAPSSGWANRNQTVYDHLSRPVWELFWAKNSSGDDVLARSTTTSYTHDSVEVTPHRGGRTRTVMDAYERTIRVEEHDGTAFRPTAYGYDPADRLVSVTDPAGNRITYSYDLAGRRVTMDDPDAGDWTYGYDAAGNQTRVTDATGSSVHTVYDPLNRPVERRSGGAGGTLLASWAYDAPGELGLLDRSTRHHSSGEWVVDVAGYDERNRPLGRAWTVPAGVEGLSGSYAVSYGYDAADHQVSVEYPAWAAWRRRR